MKAIIFILTLGLLFFPVLIFAQTFTGPPSFSPDVLDNPIDGGLGLLLGAGITYGATKVRNRHNKKKREKNQKNK